MSRAVAWLVIAVVALSVLNSAGPTLVGLAEAAVPLIIAIGCVAIAARIVWHFTSWY